MIKSLFRNRVVYAYKQKWGTYRTVLDWTVCLYIMIPLSIFIIVQYIELMQSIATWAHYITSPIWTLGLTLLTSFFSSYLYIEEADTVFLNQKKKLLYDLKQKSFRLALGKSFIITIILFSLVYPILVIQIQPSILTSGLIFLYFWLAQTVFLWIHFYTPIWFPKRLQQIVMKTIFIVTIILTHFYYFSNLVQNFYICIVISLAIFILIIMGRKQILQNKYLVLEIQESEKIKLNTTRFFLQQAGVYNKKSNFSRPFFNWAPAFLSKKQHLIFLDYVRNWQRVRLIFQMTSVCLAAIFFVPLWIKTLILLFYIFFLWNELDHAKRQFHSHPFARMQQGTHRS